MLGRFFGKDNRVSGYKMISFLKFRASFLFGSTIEFRRIDSEGTTTLQPGKNIDTAVVAHQTHQHLDQYDLPRIVMEGFNRPSLLKSGGFSIFANGLLGSGSLGVPSTRAHCPTLDPRPTTLCRISVCCSMTAFSRMIDSRIRTPGPMVTPAPIDTLGPRTAVWWTVAFGWM